MSYTAGVAADEFDPPPPPSIAVPEHPKDAVCNALRNTRDEVTGERLRCQQRAGWGTDHLGYGQCKFHGGNTASARRNGAGLRVKHITESVRDQLGQFYGLNAVLPYAAPVEVLQEELNRCRGVVAWIEQHISRWAYDPEMDGAAGGGGLLHEASVGPDGELVEAVTVRDETLSYGRMPELRLTNLPPLLTVVKGEKNAVVTDSEHRAWLRQLGEERDRLRVTAKLCIDADLDGRMVKLHEQGGMVLFQTLQLVLSRMGLESRTRELEVLVPAALGEIQDRLARSA